MSLPVVRRHRRETDRPGGDTGKRSPVRAEAARSQPAPWELSAELADLHDRMGRLVHDLFGESAQSPWPLTGWRPTADVEESDDAYLVEIELPGVRREDVSVELGLGELVVTGEIIERKRLGFMRTRTRRTGRFDYRLSLPADVDSDAVSAVLSDGVLTVRVPKTEQAKRRRIAVTSSAAPAD